MTGNNSTVLYDNGMYQVVSGDAIASEHKAMLYRVENKEHGVVEAETTILMRALFCADDYKAGVMMHGEEAGAGLDYGTLGLPEGTVLS